MSYELETPEPQRLSAMFAGILVLALVAIMGVGILRMWGSRWATVLSRTLAPSENGNAETAG